MLNKWNYANCNTPYPYGSDETYKLGMEYLAGLDVEDWGCGTGYAKNFHVGGGRYSGVDGSNSKFNDVHADLRNYRSSTDGIFMRHVLEHNPDWRMIFENALAAFRKRMVLILFTPIVTETRTIAVNPAGIVDIAFRLDDLETICKAKSIKTVDSPHSQYFRETVLFYSKKEAAESA